MAWMEINSPHNGRPVRVRDKDVGRSVRDGDGRIFFVLERSDGEGYYASVTRQGGPDHEKKYDEMVAKESHAKEVGAATTQQQIHDATGRRRSSARGKLVILFLALIVLLLAYLFTIGPFGSGSWPWQAPPTRDTPTKDAPTKDAPTKDAPAKDIPEKDGPAGKNNEKDSVWVPHLLNSPPLVFHSTGLNRYDAMAYLLPCVDDRSARPHHDRGIRVSTFH